MRINLDMLRTRNREDIYLAASINAKQSFVVDNTNPSVEERKKYIILAKEYGFKVIGYYFEPDYELSNERNNLRQGKERVHEVGIKSTLKKLQFPSYAEGFDELYKVTSKDQKFIIEKVH